jgi:hypothetical protein
MQLPQKKPLTVRTFCYKYSFLVMDSSVTGIIEPKKDKVSYFGKIMLRFLVLEKLS